MAGSLQTSVEIVATDKATKPLRGIAKEAEGLCQRLDEMTKRLSAPFTQLKAGFGVFKIFGEAKEIALSAARYETLGISMHKVGENAGYSRAEMEKFEAQLVKNGISLQNSREVLGRLAASQVDLAKSGELARISQDVAVISGLDSSQALEKIVHGIVTAQPQILRTAGLVVDFESAYAKAAATMGKNTNALTDAEKMQIRLNAALEAGKGYAGTYELAMTTAGKQLGSFERHLSNFKTLAGEVTLDALATGVFGVNTKLESVNDTLMKLRESGDLKEVGQTISNVFRVIIDNADEAALVLGTLYLTNTKLAQSAGASIQTRYTSAMAVKQEIGGLNALKVAIDGTTASYIANQRAYIANKNAELAPIKTRIGNLQWTFGEYESQYGKYKGGNNTYLDKKQKELNKLLKREVELRGEIATAQNGISAAIDKSTKSMTGFQRLGAGFSGLMNMFGGPWVVGITAATAAIYSIATADSYAEKEAKKYGIALDSLDTKYQNLVDAALGAAKSTDNLTAAQARNSQKVVQENIKNTEKEVERLRALISDTKTYDSDSWGSAVVYDTEPVAKLEVYVNKLRSQFKAGELTAEDFAIALGDTRKQLEELQKTHADKWFDETDEEAAQLAGRVGLLEGGVHGLIAALKKLSAFEPKTVFKADSLLDVWLPDQAKIAEAHAKTSEMKRETLLATRDNYEAQLRITPNDARLNTLLKEANKELSDFDNRLAKTGGVDKRTSAYERLNDEIARMTMGESEYARHQLDAKLADLRKSGVDEGTLTRYTGAWESDRLKKEQEEYRKKLDQTLQVRLDFEKEYGQLTGIGTEAVIASLQRQYDEYQQAGISIVQLEEWKKNKIIDASNTAAAGAMRALRNYGRDATDAAKNLEMVLSNCFSGMEDSIVNACTKGKLSFKDMANSMISDILRVMTRQFITGPISSGLGGIIGNLFNFNGGGSSFGAGAPGGMSWDSWGSFGDLFHTGGIVGRTPVPALAVPAGFFDNAPRYHRGGRIPGLASDERPAILLTGEQVLNRAETAAYNKGGAPVAITVSLKNESGQQLQATSSETKWSGDMGSAVIEIVLDAVNRNRMGMRDALRG